MNKARNLISFVTATAIIIAYYAFKLPQYMGRVFAWNLTDADDVGRVLQVRAWLAGQDFYDLFNHRSNPPLGADMHWSRLSDLPLAITELILRPFFGIELAEKYGVAFTPIWLCLIFAILAALVTNRLYKSPFTGVLAAALIYLSPVLQSNFVPGRVDHHGLQLIFLALAIYGATLNSRLGGILGAFGIAAGLTIGFEAIVFEIIICAFFAIIWVFEGESRKAQLSNFALFLAIFILIGLFINVAPSKIMDGANDRLSIAQIAPILVGCLGLWLVANLQSHAKPLIKFVILGAIGVCVILIAAQFPVLFKKLYWQIDEKYYRLWMLDCPDTNPLITFPLHIQIMYGLFCASAAMAALVKLVVLYRQKNTKDFANWALLTFLMVIAAAMTFFFQARLMGQAAGLAILIVTPLIVEVFSASGLLIALIVGFGLSPLASDNLSSFARKFYDTKNAKYQYDGNFNCHTLDDFAHLGKMPKGLVAGNLNLGPETLINTSHNVLATGFHRDLGRNLVFPIFLSDDKDAEQKIRNLGVNYVAYCQRSPEIGRLTDDAPNGLMAHLAKGQVPNYLREIARTNNSDVIAFEVLSQN